MHRKWKQILFNKDNRILISFLNKWHQIITISLFKITLLENPINNIQTMEPIKFPLISHYSKHTFKVLAFNKINNKIQI